VPTTDYPCLPTGTPCLSLVYSPRNIDCGFVPCVGLRFMTSRSPKPLAITGGIACGKSEVGRVFSAAGFDRLDTDLLAHELMKAGTPVFDRVIERFGKRVLDRDGEIDRTKLGRIIFADPKARETLNGLVHSAVIEATQEWVAKCQATNKKSLVLVPLLFEVNWTEGWNAVICVAAKEAVVLQRLKKRGLSEEDAHRRIAAQMPLTEKKHRADFTIENNGSLEQLQRNAETLLKRMGNPRKNDE